MRLVWLLGALLLASGCGAGLVYIAPRDEGNRYADRVADPKTDRCKAQKDYRRRDRCEQLREEARRFVARLAVDDQLCLEGQPMGDGVTRACAARGVVSDVGVNKVKVEVREVEPGGPYSPMQNLWFTEAALVDLYLKSAGFRTP